MVRSTRAGGGKVAAPKAAAATVKKTTTTITKNKKTGSTATKKKSTATTVTNQKPSTLHSFATVKKSSSASSEATKKTRVKNQVADSSLLEEIVDEQDNTEKDGTTDIVDLIGNKKQKGGVKGNHDDGEQQQLLTPRKTLKRKAVEINEENEEETGSGDDGVFQDSNDTVVTAPSTPSKRANKKLKSDLESTPKQLLTPPASTHKGSQQVLAGLPTVLANYVTIHSNLLTHLLLHYSQKSINTPEIVADLIPHLSRASRKDVTLDDLRRISWLSAGTVNIVHTERGTGIELAGDGVLAKIDALRLGFGENVRRWWDENKEDISSEEKDDVLGAMELADIVEAKVSRGKITAKTVKKTLLAKGQQRLSELKKFSITKKAITTTTVTEGSGEESKSTTSLAATLFKKETVAKPPAPAAAVRGNSLLERIRAKQAMANAAPPPPPTEVLQRQSALQSLESIIPILLQLSTSSKKTSGKSASSTTASFPLHVVLTHIKNSARTPISNEDAERAVRLLASEVAPSFCRVIEWQTVSKTDAKTPVGVVLDIKGKEVVQKWKWKEGM